MNFLRHGFRKLSFSWLWQTYRQTDTTEIIYHAVFAGDQKVAAVYTMAAKRLAVCKRYVWMWIYNGSWTTISRWRCIADEVIPLTVVSKQDKLDLNNLTNLANLKQS